MKIRKLRWFIAAAVIVGVVVFWMVSHEKKADSIAHPQSLDITFNKQGELYFIDAEQGDTLSSIEIEIADDEQSRAQGLMYRKSLPQNAGMLFVQDREEMQSFWMKNTYIPLDMVFANSEKKIVTIRANAAPLEEWSYSSSLPSLYVVEVNAGYCAAKGISEGDEIEFRIDKKR